MLIAILHGAAVAKLKRNLLPNMKLVLLAGERDAENNIGVGRRTGVLRKGEANKAEQSQNEPAIHREPPLRTIRHHYLARRIVTQFGCGGGLPELPTGLSGFKTLCGGSNYTRTIGSRNGQQRIDVGFRVSGRLRVEHKKSQRTNSVENPTPRDESDAIDSFGHPGALHRRN